jgi:hypothetical protein
MSRLFLYSVPAICATAMLVLAVGAQPPVAPVTSQTAPTAQTTPRAPYKPRNLKVLPQDTNLRVVMDQYDVDLGVRCEFCHAPADPATHRSDRASDANPTKDVARFMIQMTADLNTKYLDEMPNRRYADPVTCGTCHRGEKHPSVFAPTPEPDANRPAAPAAASPQPGK